MAKLRRLGKDAEQQIIKLKAKGLSSTAIAEEIKKQYGVNIHPTNILRFINKRLTHFRSQSQGIAESREEAAEMLKILHDDMRKIKDKLWNLIERIEQMDATNTMEIRATLSVLINHVKVMNQLLGDAQVTHVEQVDVLDISTRLPKILHELEEKGYIEIKKDVSF